MVKKILIDKKDKIFIAGHNGMVGNSIKETFLRNGYNNLLFEDRKKLDLTNLIKVIEFFEIHRPDVVVLAAAKVGGIVANSKYPTEFILENLKIQTNIIEIAISIIFVCIFKFSSMNSVGYLEFATIPPTFAAAKTTTSGL